MAHNHIGSRLAALSPRAKLAMMLGGDAVFLPLCVVAAVALRLGSLPEALDRGLPLQLLVGLLALPALAVTITRRSM